MSSRSTTKVKVQGASNVTSLLNKRDFPDIRDPFEEGFLEIRKRLAMKSLKREDWAP